MQKASNLCAFEAIAFVAMNFVCEELYDLIAPALIDLRRMCS